MFKQIVNAHCISLLIALFDLNTAGPEKRFHAVKYSQAGRVHRSPQWLQNYTLGGKTLTFLSHCE